MKYSRTHVLLKRRDTWEWGLQKPSVYSPVNSRVRKLLLGPYQVQGPLLGSETRKVNKRVMASPLLWCKICGKSNVNEGVARRLCQS